MIIIWGSKGITSTTGKGNFVCPTCTEQRSFARKKVRRFFTLYFIPLIPMSNLGEYVECNRCRNTFDPKVLRRDVQESLQSDNEFAAEFHAVIARTMALMALADGHIDDSEVEVIAYIYGKLAGVKLTDDDVMAEIKEAQTEGRDLLPYLKEVGLRLNDHGREMVVRSAMMVAAADDDFDDSEKQLLIDIAKAVQFPLRRTHEIMNQVMSDAG